MEANKVTIPKGYFFTVSKNEYSDYQTRLIQELLQNSVDAKAEDIYIDFTDEGYSIRDNGKGMTAQTMVDGLLTFGGSQKDEGAAGGFGHAKILLLFAMDSFEVHSHATNAIGEGLDYVLDKNNPVYVHGTVVKGKFPAAWNGNKEIMIAKAQSLLRKCELSARVYINGVQWTKWMTTTRCVEQNDWSKLYTNALAYDNQYVIVRKNGMFMFEKYLGQAIQKQVILEVTKNSKEVFNANRDGLKPAADKDFTALFARIIADKKSFDKAKPRRFMFSGMTDYFSKFLSEGNEALGMVFSTVSAEVTTLKAAIAAQDLNAIRQVAWTTSGEVSAAANQAYAFVKKALLASFIVDMGGTSFDSIPKRYDPNTMAESNKAIARLWKSALDTVFAANKMTSRYRIGFILNPKTNAQYQSLNGVEEFLINPNAPCMEEDKWKKVYSLIVLACHEIAHRGQPYHDENFILTEEKLLLNTLTFIKGDTNVVSKGAKNLEI